MGPRSEKHLLLETLLAVLPTCGLSSPSPRSLLWETSYSLEEAGDQGTAHLES